MANNPYADVLKVWTDAKTPSFDYNSFLTIGRRNMEAASSANQTIVEGAQAVSRRQAELARTNVEQMLRTAKDLLGNGSPEINTTKQVALAKDLFESSLNNLREVSEMFTRLSFEAFDIINKRAAESLDEISSASKTAAKKATKAAA